MAQINITLNREEILQLLSNNPGDAFKNILQTSLDKILQAESSEQLKAKPYERSEERTDSIQTVTISAISTGWKELAQ